MKITAIEQQAHDAERYNLHADNRFLMGVNALIVLQLHLEIGQELTPELMNQLQAAELRQKAIDNALNFLSFRPRSRSEVQQHLKKKEFPPEIIDLALEHLDRLDFVNDRDFATFWKETRDHFSPRGASALKNELRQKGVEREIIDEMITGEDDQEQALEAGRKKARSLLRSPEADYQSYHNKLVSFLARRGFSYSIANQVAQTLWTELMGEAVPDRSSLRTSKKHPPQKEPEIEASPEESSELASIESNDDDEESEDPDEAAARAAAYDKAMSLLRLPKMDFQTFNRRLSAFLQRRGYNYSIVKQVVKNLWDEAKNA